MHTQSPTELTILIPTRNRLVYLQRLVRYLRAVACPYPIVVSDSSSTDEIATWLAHESHGLSLTTLRFPYEMGLFAKYFETLGQIHTPYVVICGDDDFHVMDALAESVQILNTHPDVAIVSGEMATITTTPQLMTLHYAQHAILDDNAPKRLIHHAQRYAPTVYAVHRHANLMQNMRLASIFDPDYILTELLISFLNAIQGKLWKLDTLYMVRQYEANMAGKYNISLDDSLASAQYPQNFAQFFGILRDALRQHSPLSDSDAYQVAQDALREYVQVYAQLAQKTIRYTFEGRVVEAIPTPISVSRPTPPLVHKVLWKLGIRKPAPKSLMALTQPTSVYYRAFLPIHQAMLESHS